MRLSLKGTGGGGTGILSVADQAARLALVPTNGLIVIQLDTDELWAYDGTSSTWLRVGGPTLAHTFTDSSSIDFTYNGTTQDLTAALKLSAAAAGAGNLKISNTLESDGLLSQIPPATALQNGYLTSTDWALFDQARQDIDAHVIDTAAHDAADLVFDPSYLGSTLSSTNIQAAIEELDTDTDGRLDLLETDQHVAATIGAFGATPNADGLSISGQAISMQPADATNPGGVSTTTQSFLGRKTFLNGAEFDEYIRVPLGDTSATVIRAISGDWGSNEGLFTNRNTVGTPFNEMGFIFGSRVFGFTSTGNLYLADGTPTTAAARDDAGLIADFQADSRAFRIPVQDNTLKAAIPSPSLGAMIFLSDTDIKRPEYFDGTEWQPMDGSYKAIPTAQYADLAVIPVSTFKRRLNYVESTGGNVTCTVEDGTYDGQELLLAGKDDTDTVMLEPGANLSINGTMLLGLGDVIHLFWDEAASSWFEVCRNS